MKTLLIEDDFTSRLLMQEILMRYGTVSIAVNGREAVKAVRTAMDAGESYDLICMDFTMPEMDDCEEIKKLRCMKAVIGNPNCPEGKVFMTTSIDGAKNVVDAFRGLFDFHLLKPIEASKLLENMHKLGFVE